MKRCERESCGEDEAFAQKISRSDPSNYSLPDHPSLHSLFLNQHTSLAIMKHLEEKSLAMLARTSRAFLRVTSANAVWIPRILKKYLLSVSYAQDARRSHLTALFSCFPDAKRAFQLIVTLVPSWQGTFSTHNRDFINRDIEFGTLTLLPSMDFTLGFKKHGRIIFWRSGFYIFNDSSGATLYCMNSEKISSKIKILGFQERASPPAETSLSMIWYLDAPEPSLANTIYKFYSSSRQ